MHEKKNTILIVDDEPQIRKMLNIYLEASDYKIEESETGKQAIRMSTSIKPDLILLDLGLPDLDGKEVISSIRQWSQVPIVVLTVRSDDEEVVAALKWARTIISSSRLMPMYCWRVFRRICAKQR